MILYTKKSDGKGRRMSKIGSGWSTGVGTVTLVIVCSASVFNQQFIGISVSVFGKLITNFPNMHTEWHQGEIPEETHKSENTESHNLGFMKLSHKNRTGTASIWRAREQEENENEKRGEGILRNEAHPFKFVMNVNQTFTNNHVSSFSSCAVPQPWLLSLQL